MFEREKFAKGGQRKEKKVVAELPIHRVEEFWTLLGFSAVANTGNVGSPGSSALCFWWDVKEDEHLLTDLRAEGKKEVLIERKL